MSNSGSPGVEDKYAGLRGLKWSQEEKAIARRAFERALHLELEEVMGKARKMAGKGKEPDDLWRLEAYLTRRRREIDREYDYRYSVLHSVFGYLIRKGRLREKDLDGLGEDKLEFIRKIVAS